MKVHHITFNKVYPVLFCMLFLAFGCKNNDEALVKETRILQEPTLEQLERFSYLSARRDSFRIIEFGDTIFAEVYYNSPRKGTVKYMKCLERAKNGLCSKTLEYYKIYISCRSASWLGFSYFINYDYVHDSIQFEMPIWGAGSIAISDLRNQNAATYIGNYIHNNKLYTHVHKLESKSEISFVAFVNDSVGLITYKHRDVYTAEQW